MNRYSRLDNQSPAVKAMESNDVNVGRSAHDCSHIVNGNAMIGMLAPVLTMEVVLNEDIDINLASLIEFRNPSTRHLFNSFRVYFHGYFNALTDLWEGARNWLDNGRSGKILLTRPNLVYHVESTYTGETNSRKVNACTPMSLLNFMGMPVEAYQTDCGTTYDSVQQVRSPLHQFLASIKKDPSSAGGKTYKYDVDVIGNSTDYFPADVCMAYQRNWRDFYSNKNLLQNNKYWFPDNEDHFILSYSCENAVCINYEDEDLLKYSNNNLPAQARNEERNLTGDFSLTHGTSDNAYYYKTPEPSNPLTVTPPGGFTPADFAPNLSAIKFRQFRGDRFTTGSPFPELIRGDIPSLSMNLENFNAIFTGKSKPVTINEVNSSADADTWSDIYNGTRGSNGFYLEHDYSGILEDNEIQGTEATLRGNYTPEGTVTLSGTASTVITMSDIYTLETLTAFRRKMGMTNGDYAETMQSQFGVRPKIHDRKGTYIGGFYQDFALSSVTQQSESGTTPLGTKAGQGISSGSGRIGHIHTTDFGWIQVYMSIMPDVYYTQGKPRQFSKRSNLEMYFPLFNNLPAQAIRNDELFITGNAVTDSSPFAYEDRYAEFKSIPNRVCGLMGLPVEKAEFDTARVIARRFSSSPALNSLFVTAVPENVDMSVFSVVDEPPFDFSIGFSIRRVFPGPYAAIEGSLSSPRLNA